MNEKEDCQVALVRFVGWTMIRSDSEDDCVEMDRVEDVMAI